jgi:raffinose/stachyose/melibiose transport system substrate-binding protein
LRKILLLIVVLGLLCSTFTGCAGPQSPSGSNTGSTETAPQKKIITISYMASQDWVQKAEQDVGVKFEEETGIKVDYQIVPADQYQNLLKTKLNAGECTDLFGNQSGKFDIVSLLDIEKNGVDLSNEEWAKRFDPLAAEQLSVNGKLYGMTLADVSAVWGICYMYCLKQYKRGDFLSAA